MSRNSVCLACALFAALASGCGKNKFERELEIESAAVGLSREVEAGDYQLIDSDELKKLIDDKKDMLLIDAMPHAESYTKQHIAGAKNFLFDKAAGDTKAWDAKGCGGKTQEDYEKLLGDDKEKLIVVYCGFVKCARSHNAAAWARQLGFTNVKRYSGGIYAWKGKGFETKSGG